MHSRMARIVTFACAGLVLVGVAPCGAQGSAAGSPEITYVRSRDAKGVRVMDLMVMDADGSNQTVLATSAGGGIGKITYPLWSPDLSDDAGYQGMIVYQDMMLPYWPLFGVEVREEGNGRFAWSAPKQFAFDPVSDATPFLQPFSASWSPDGKWIAMGAEGKDPSTVTAYGVFVVQAPVLGATSLGGKPQLVIDRPLGCPPPVCWDPGSTLLAYANGCDLLIQSVIGDDGAPLGSASPGLAGTLVANAFPPDSYGSPQTSSLSWDIRHGIAFGGTTMIESTDRRGRTQVQAATALYVADPAWLGASPPPRLDQLQPLAGTAGASSPCWSADGDWLVTKVSGQIVKIPAAGGYPAPLLTSTSKVIYSMPVWRPAAR